MTKLGSSTPSTRSDHEKWWIQTFREGGGGRGHPDPKIKRGRSQKNLFPALRASVWSKYKGGEPPLDLPLMRVQCIKYLSSRWREECTGIQVMGEIE